MMLSINVLIQDINKQQMVVAIMEGLPGYKRSPFRELCEMIIFRDCIPKYALPIARRVMATSEVTDIDLIYSKIEQYIPSISVIMPDYANTSDPEAEALAHVAAVISVELNSVS